METTDRIELPLLSAGQAQKEQSHNEALARLDLLVQPVVQGVAPGSPPPAPELGECWIVGSGASGAWSGHDGALAGWTQGGWRFAALPLGAQVWSLADGCAARRTATGWAIGEVRGRRMLVDGEQVVGARQAAVSLPAGGATIDAEARAALATVLARLQAHGLIAGS